MSSTRHHHLHVVSTESLPDRSEDNHVEDEGIRVCRGFLIGGLISLALWACIISSLVKLFGFLA
jgi:hypothetical protein